ncbi:PAS domain-containing protein [Sphingomonas sp. 1P08PE]|uniref:hybrid sensor histidine kinase/response regulator n=1 Tax=Sphingomonas sp. 1P08PE TaxID=554122 RepID=UPI0039A04C01
MTDRNTPASEPHEPARALLDAIDWPASPLGDRAGWPQSLRTLIRTMLASRHGMMLAWGPELTLFYNDAYAPFLGKRHPWAFGRPFQQVWSDVWAEIAPLVDRALGGEAVWFEDYHLVMQRNGYPEDTWWQFSYSPVHDDRGNVAGMLNVASDMTGKVVAERRLHALNVDLEQRVIARAMQSGTLWQISSDLLSVIDMSTTVIEAVNPAWTAALGWQQGEIEGRSYLDFLHPDDRDASRDAFERVRAGQAVLRFENRYRTRDGEWRWLSWVALPEGGKLYSTVRDLTEEKARTAQLEATQEALRQSQKMESMGQLTGGVAHDFNNLLTPIIGSLDLLERRGVGSERERRLIGGALASAERARTLVQRLLAFARRQPLQPVPVDIAALVDGLAGLIDSTLGPQIDVRVAIDPDLPPAIADPNQMEMALLNLAVNARDAMPGGGTLTIAATRESVRVDNPDGVPRGHYVRLCVRDTGTGMDQPTRMRAVEPFFSTKGIGKGTGLGLSMVHGLVAQLGGKLMIDSAPDAGTTIELWLPVSLVPVAVPGDAPATPAALLERGTALLVDDEDLVRMTTADMLGDLGFDVVETSTAEEALHQIDGGLAPAVVVTDHLMPGMTGADLASRLRSLRPDLPVLIVSGYAEADGIAIDTARLTKPFRNADLAASLAAIVPGFTTDDGGKAGA